MRNLCNYIIISILKSIIYFLKSSFIIFIRVIPWKSEVLSLNYVHAFFKFSSKDRYVSF